MPIKIPNDLPARATLEAEGVMVMREADAIRQDIRPLRIGLLNLMPNKIRTETQLARLLGATPLQVELTLVRITDQVLVGHGAAGPLLPQIGFARQAVGRPVSGYVFVDALLPRTMRPASLMDLITSPDDRQADGLTQRIAEDGMFPIPDPDVRAALLADLRPRGLDFFTETLPSPIDWPDAPCGFVQLSDTFATEARTAAQRGWTVTSVEAHHFWAMSDPDGLARALGDVLASWDDGG